MVKEENKLEKYKFLRLYDMDLEMALQSIEMMKRYRRKDIRYSIIRDVIVTYCRPFTESKGIKIKKDLMAVKFTSQDMQSLHNELLTLRKQLFAHTDLIYKKPEVSNWSTEVYKWFPMSFRGFDYSSLDNRVSEIKELVLYSQVQLRKQIAEYEKCF